MSLCVCVLGSLHMYTCHIKTPSISLRYNCLCSLLWACVYAALCVSVRIHYIQVYDSIISLPLLCICKCVCLQLCVSLLDVFVLEKCFWSVPLPNLWGLLCPIRQLVWVAVVTWLPFLASLFPFINPSHRPFICPPCSQRVRKENKWLSVLRRHSKCMFWCL